VSRTSHRGEIPAVIDYEPVAHAPLVRPTLFAGIVTIRADAFTTPTSGPRRLPEITMSRSLGALVSVKIIPNEHGAPEGKRADVKVVFESEAGPLSGLKLVGFGSQARHLTTPSVTALQSRSALHLSVIS
jgi:hypothetical protein